jgi:hypothetical protein
MSWLSDAIGWATDQAQGFNNWFADAVGDVWDGVGSTFGFETTADKMRKEQTDKLTNAWQAKRQELTDSWNKYKDEWTGTNGAARALENAKAATGSITAAQAEGTTEAIKNAQRNTGINKAQAAMNAVNTTGSTYAEQYDSNLAEQQDIITKQIETQNSQMEDAYNKETNLLDEQYQSGLADVANMKNSDLGLGAQLTISDIFGQDARTFGKINITSDENAKENLLPVNADTCVLQLMTILKDFEPQTPEDVQLLIMAMQFLQLYLKRRENVTI